MKKIIIVLALFLLDRITKIYLLNLQASGTDIDFYINSLLNFYLVWNTGIGFGLISIETNIYYHILTIIIVIINIGLIYFLIKSKGVYSYLLAIIGAEYVLKWLPIGTHEWDKFVKPSELIEIAKKNNLKLRKIDGMNFNPFFEKWNISDDKSVNYISKFEKY